MQITLNTEELSSTDKQILALLAGGASASTESKPAAPAKPAASKPAATKAKAAEPEPAADEPTEGPTLEAAVAAATTLVSTGKAKEVKAALESVGAKRVSELEGDAIASFLAALDA